MLYICNMKIQRVYIVTSEKCPACKALKELWGMKGQKLSIGDVDIHEISLSKNIHFDRIKQLGAKSTPFVAIFEVEDTNGNGIYEEIEETKPLFTSDFLSKRGLEDILFKIKKGEIIKTEING